MTTAIELKDDAHCFVCGKSNMGGLHLVWKTDGNVTETDFYPRKTHQGWQGLVHGGILAAVLDEAVTRLAWETHGAAVTAEITVRYHNPARIGEKLSVRGELGEAKGRLVPGKAEIRNAQGHLVASATAKAVKTKAP